jgi:hypothetical protein
MKHLGLDNWFLAGIRIGDLIRSKSANLSLASFVNVVTVIVIRKSVYWRFSENSVF